jgi:D-lactate dehydrogenase (cytochrome)
VSLTQERLKVDGFISPIVGHVGDGNFHCLLLIDKENEDEIMRAATFVSWLNNLAISLDGTCTGEHGIGQGKMPYLERELGSATVDAMIAIKGALDPDGIMNPGKVVRG